MDEHTHRRIATSRFGLFTFLACCLIFLATPALSFRSTVLYGVDFKTVYSSSRCLRDQCNPYDPASLLNEYIRGDGDRSAESDMSAFGLYQALYPPSALFWIVPFTFLSWKAALAVWMTINALLFVTAACLVADLCAGARNPIPLILLGLFVATSTVLITSAQPTALAISLCTIGVWSFLKDRLTILGIICFGLGLTLKPQLGGLVILYFLFAGQRFRRLAIQTFAVCALFSLPGILWVSLNPASAHWPHDLSRNVAGSSSPARINDPTPTSTVAASLMTNLQSVVAVFDDKPSVYNGITWIVVGTLLLVWAYVAFRARPSPRKDLLGIATIVCLCLLPVYHRHYDMRFMFLTVPALASLVEESGLMGGLAVCISLLVLICSHPTFLREHLRINLASLGTWDTVFFMRVPALVVLLASLFYLALFVGTLRNDQPDSQNP